MFYESVDIEYNKEIGEDIWLLGISSGKLALNARPGQFVMIRPMNTTADPLLRRPFSIHGIESKNTVMILYKVVGKGTQLLSTLKPQCRISIVGPLGNGFPLPKPHERAMLVGGGIGIAPLFFLAQTLQGIQENKISVLFGFSSAHEVVRIEQLKNMNVELSCSTEDGSLGIKGLVTDLLDQRLLSRHADKSIIYTCGPKAMLKEVARRAAELKYTCYVSLEAYMACGLGLCLGCAIKAAPGGEHEFQYACKDGPVFRSEIVDWEAFSCLNHQTFP